MKINKIIIGFILPLILQSCLFSEDDYFDASSAQRAMASVEECKTILESASNGWHIEYYTGENAEFGGYNLYAKFEGENVHMASEMPTTNFQVGEICSSLYKVTSVQSTELSFDSYNELIHKFCEPDGYKDPGFAGDYEFIFLKLSQEKIVMKGKKHGNQIVMTPLPIGLDWKKSLLNIFDLQQNSPYATYKFRAGEKEIALLRANHSWKITSNDEQGEKVTTTYPFIYTEQGIKMLRPMELNGVSVSDMRWEQESRSFISENGNASAKIEFYCPEKYGEYMGMYYLIGCGTPIVTNISKNVEGLDYKVTLSSKNIAGTDFILKATYNMETDCIDLPMQYMDIYGSFHVYLLPWESNIGSLTWQEGTGLSGYVDSKEGEMLKIKFKDNGVWKMANGFAISGFSGSTSSENYKGSFLLCANPTLIKLF